MYFGPDDQRRLLFKVNGPYDSDPISRNHYLHSLRRKFREMSMRSRNKFRKAHELTKIELQFLLSFVKNKLKIDEEKIKMSHI